MTIFWCTKSRHDCSACPQTGVVSILCISPHPELKSEDGLWFLEYVTPGISNADMSYLWAGRDHYFSFCGLNDDLWGNDNGSMTDWGGECRLAIVYFGSETVDCPSVITRKYEDGGRLIGLLYPVTFTLWWDEKASVGGKFRHLVCHRHLVLRLWWCYI